MADSKAAWSTSFRSSSVRLCTKICWRCGLAHKGARLTKHESLGLNLQCVLVEWRCETVVLYVRAALLSDLSMSHAQLANPTRALLRGQLLEVRHQLFDGLVRYVLVGIHGVWCALGGVKSQIRRPHAGGSLGLIGQCASRYWCCFLSARTTLPRRTRVMGMWLRNCLLCSSEP
jgi:hypothetical protein